MKRVFTIKYFFLFLIFLITNEVFSQWSNDPNNNLIVGIGWDPHIVSDSTGGCYVTYNYESFYPQKLAVERLDKYGYKPWVTKKQILGELPEQWQAEIVEDGESGVIVSYEDNEVIGSNYITRVRVQRVDSNGNFLWGQTGVRVSIEEKTHGAQKLVNDGEGGCVVLWEDIIGNHYINRITASGERAWGDSGKVIGSSAYTGLDIIRASDANYYVETGELIYRIRQNGEIALWDSTLEWGMIVATPIDGGGILHHTDWHYPSYDLFAQRKDTLGNNLWLDPYVNVGDSIYYNSRVQIGYNCGYFYYGWTGQKNGISKVAQYQALRLDGSVLFPDGSIQIGDPPLNGMIVQPLEENRTAFIYYNKDHLPDSLLVQAYDTLGNKLWTENGVIIAHPPIEYQSYATDGNGGFIIGGVINNFTVVAQQVSKYGNLGEVIIPVELISFYANGTKDKVELFWQTATEINNQGFEILRFTQNDNTGWERIGFVEGSGTTTEPKTYSFIDNNVTGGIYKYKLKQIDFDGTFEYSNEIEVKVNLNPKEFTLYQNYPNPFNSSTTIKYELPEDGLVTLKVYDILGNEVAGLVNEEKQAGYYSIKFNASDLSSGIYFYRLNTGNFSSTKKLLLLK